MILDETLEELRARGELSGRSIRAVYPTRYFTIVKLNDGGVGAAMSYCRQITARETEALKQRIERIRETDPLLLRWLFEVSEPGRQVGCDGEEGFLLTQCLRTAVLSALSDRLLRAGGDDAFMTSSSLPADYFAPFRSALVIGFGGYMKCFADSEHIANLHVCDLEYNARTAEMESLADLYRKKRPDFQFTISDGKDVRSRMREADVAAITGSALCNGTLEELLEAASGGPQVVVQGQSAGMLPTALFRRGVAMTTTTLKTQELAELAAADSTGELMRPLLEGGLPWIYCFPQAIRDSISGSARELRFAGG